MSGEMLAGPSIWAAEILGVGVAAAARPTVSTFGGILGYRDELMLPEARVAEVYRFALASM